MLPPRVLELVFESSESLSDGDAPASAPTLFVATSAHLHADLVAPTALPAPPRMPSDAVQVPPPPRMPYLSLVESVPARPSSRPTVRVGSNRSQKVVRVLRHTPSRPPPPSLPPPPGSAPIRKAA